MVVSFVTANRIIILEPTFGMGQYLVVQEQAATDNNAELTISEEKGLKTIAIVAKGKVPKGGYKSVIVTCRASDGHMVKMELEEAIGIINTYEIK